MLAVGRRLRNAEPFLGSDRDRIRFEPATGLALLWEAGLRGSTEAAAELATHFIRRCRRTPESTLAPPRAEASRPSTSWRVAARSKAGRTSSRRSTTESSRA
jgi:hypothetical protein